MVHVAPHPSAMRSLSRRWSFLRRARDDKYDGKCFHVKGLPILCAVLAPARIRMPYAKIEMELRSKASRTCCSHFAPAKKKACMERKVVPRGLEPRTLRFLAVRSNQLSYETIGGWAMKNLFGAHGKTNEGRCRVMYQSVDSCCYVQ